MMARYVVVASRIRQELVDIDQVVARAERAVTAACRRPEDKDLCDCQDPPARRGANGQREF